MANGLIWLGLGSFSLCWEERSIRPSSSMLQFLRPDHLKIHNRKQRYCTGLGICKRNHSAIYSVKVFLRFLLLGSEFKNGWGNRIRTQGGNFPILSILFVTDFLSCLSTESRPHSERNNISLLEYLCVLNILSWQTSVRTKILSDVFTNI